MTWEELLADLELRFAAERAVRLAGEVDERRAAELGGLTLTDRLRPLLGAEDRIGVAFLGHEPVHGPLRGLGADWLLLGAPGAEVLVVLDQIRWVEGLGQRSEPRAPRPSDGALALRHVLGGLARDRSEVQLMLSDGSGTRGTLDAAGRDHVLVTLHPAGEARRAEAVLGVRALHLGALAAVRRAL